MTLKFVFSRTSPRIVNSGIEKGTNALSDPHWENLMELMELMDRIPGIEWISTITNVYLLADKIEVSSDLLYYIITYFWTQ